MKYKDSTKSQVSVCPLFLCSVIVADVADFFFFFHTKWFLRFVMFVKTNSRCPVALYILSYIKLLDALIRELRQWCGHTCLLLLHSD